MARGDFDLPVTGVKAREEFTRRVDQVRTWVDECAVVDKQLPFVNRTWLYGCYKDWTGRDGYKAVKAHEFYDRLATIPGVVHTRRGQGDRGFTGISVSDTAEDFSQWRR